jgi:hypothetical protein
LTLKYGGRHFFRDALRRQRLADHAARGHLGQLDASGLADERHGARCARVDFQHVDHILAITVLDGELHVHQAHHVQCAGHGRGLALDLVHRGLATG